MDNKIWVVAKREYLERVRSRWFIAMTLLVPAIMAGAFLFPIWMAARSSVSNQLGHIRIFDATGTGLGQRVAKAMFADSTLGITAGDSAAPRVETVTPAELAAKEQAAISEVQQRDHISGVLSLTDSSIAGQSARYAGRNASNISDMDKLRTIVRQSAMMVRLEREGVQHEAQLRADHGTRQERLGNRGAVRRHHRRRAALHVDRVPRTEHSPRRARRKSDTRRRGGALEREA
jgi:ABC-2 type transport system permease protein